MRTKSLIISMFLYSCGHENRQSVFPKDNLEQNEIACSYSDADLQAAISWILNTTKITSCVEAERYLFSSDTLHLTDIGLTSIDFFIEPERITYLDLSGNRIKNLQSLRRFINLKFLSLNSNEILDVSELAGLQSLEFLTIANNHITSVSGMGDMPQLKELILDRNQISDLSAFRFELPNLKSLSANENPINMKANKNSETCPTGSAVSVGLSNYCSQ